MNEQPRARDEGLVTEQVGDDLVIYDEATQTAHALAPLAASIWTRCDGTSTLEQIACSLGLDQSQVADALEQLQKVRLLDQPELVTRRQVSRRIAAAGAAAVGAPLIYSVAVPSAAAAQTPPPLCTPPCTSGPGVFVQCCPSPTGGVCCNATPGNRGTGNPSLCTGVSFQCYRTATTNVCLCPGSCNTFGSFCTPAAPCCAGQQFCQGPAGSQTCTQ